MLPYPPSFGFCHSLCPADSTYFLLLKVPPKHLLLPPSFFRTCSFLFLMPLPFVSLATSYSFFKTQFKYYLPHETVTSLLSMDT